MNLHFIVQSQVLDIITGKDTPVYERYHQTTKRFGLKKHQWGRIHEKERKHIFKLPSCKQTNMAMENPYEGNASSTGFTFQPAMLVDPGVYVFLKQLQLSKDQVRRVTSFSAPVDPLQKGTGPKEKALFQAIIFSGARHGISPEKPPTSNT